jgi:hypothetical protein
MNDPNAYQPPPPIALSINIVPLDTRRDSTLGVPLPPLQAGEQTSVSTTRTRYRLRWTYLYEWQDFENRVLAYWTQQVPDDDKQSIVASLASIQTKFSEVATGNYRTEANISDAVRDFPANLHGYAANGVCRWGATAVGCSFTILSLLGRGRIISTCWVSGFGFT